MPLCGQLWDNLPQLLVLYMASRCWTSGWEGGAGNVTGERGFVGYSSCCLFLSSRSRLES